MIKKFISVLLTCLLLLCVFGCSSKKNTIVGTWYVSNYGDGNYCFEIGEKTIKISDGDETLSLDYEIQDNTIIFTDDNYDELPFTLNEDGSLTIISSDFELVLEKNKPQSNNVEKEEKIDTNDSSNTQPPVDEILTIDLNPDYLKYRKIVFNQEYLEETIGTGKPAFSDSIEGIEVYGYYRESFEAPENFENYSHVIYNVPSEIDGLPVLSVIELHCICPNNVDIERGDINIPDGVLLLNNISCDGIGMIYAPETIKYCLTSAGIDKLPRDLEYIEGSLYLKQKEVVLDDSYMIGDYLELDGEIDTIIINSLNTLWESTRIMIGQDDTDFFDSSYDDIYYGKDHYIKEVIYNAQSQDPFYTLHVFAEKLTINDDSVVNSYITYEGSLTDNQELIIGKNVHFEKEDYIEFGGGISKLVINDANISNYLKCSYGKIIINRDAVVVNNSGEEINWNKFLKLNSECVFETGRLDFDSYFIEVVKE